MLCWTVLMTLHSCLTSHAWIKPGMCFRKSSRAKGTGGCWNRIYIHLVVNIILCKEYVECCHEGRSQGLSKELQDALRGVKEENLDLRWHGLRKLQDLLTQNQRDVHQLMLLNEDVDPVIPQVCYHVVSYSRRVSQEI